MAKVHLVVDYIKNIEIGRKISVRSIAQELGISEGTAYKAIKECDNEGYLKTLPRAGTIRVESPKEKKIKNLTYEEVLKIVDGVLLGGEKGIEKAVYKFIIGAMELDAMKKYISPGGLVIVGNREGAQNLALKNNNGVLISGGFGCTPKIKEMADKLNIPVISSSYDTFTIAMLINRAISQNLIRQRILYVGDIMKTVPKSLAPTATVADWKKMVALTGIDRIPILDDKERFLGFIGTKEVVAKDDSDTLDKHLKKSVQVNPKTTVAYAAHVMEWEDLDILPVLEGEKLLGVITRGDVLKGIKERWNQHKTTESMEDRIVENFTFEEKQGKYVFSSKVTSEMLDPLGTMSKSLLSMIMIKCTSIVLKNKNHYTEIDNTSFNFIKPLQPEHRFSIEIEIVNSSKNQSKVEVRVLNTDQECMAIGLIAAVH
ncbi:MAG: DRTGG domain-containing protein [Clostridiaceae bacterium]